MKTLIRKFSRTAITVVLVILAFIAIFNAWVYYTESPWTRDARFSADVVAIAPDVSGLITQVNVHDNQLVKKGQVLFTIDQQKNMIAFSGSHFRLPLLLRVSDKRVEPLPESEYSAPLRFQLADFAPRDNFVWVDRCYKMAQLWAPELALSTDWCVSQGQLGGQQIVQHVDKTTWKGKTAFKDTVIDMARYKGNVDTLKIVDNDIRYKADSFIFNVAGAPEEVKQFSGISRPESWGRWSNAQLGDEVKIEYKHPLPKKFDLVITAKAYGNNASRPIPVRVGNEEQTLVLGNEVTTTTLHFDNPTDADTLVIVPPEPVSTNEGNILGHSPRKLGIGMVEIKVVEREG